MRKYVQKSLPFCAIFGAILILAACQDLPVSPWGGEISVMAKVQGAASSTAFVAGSDSSLPVVDSIKIIRARFVLERIQFVQSGDSSEFKTTPFVFQPNLTGSMQEILVAGLKYGTYSRVKFKVHRLSVTDFDSIPSDQQPLFADFVAGDQYSAIIEGLYYQGGQGPQPFTYRSKIDAEEQFGLTAPLVLSEESTTASVTMTMSPSFWFKDTRRGLLDPTDPANRNEIDRSLRESIMVYKDCNKDGAPDL